MADEEVVKLCVLGAGSVRCMPAVIGSLATYFGERPLEVRFWDADAERLDLFDRFARFLFAFNKCDHRLLSTDDAAEALDGAGRLLLTVGKNCARKALGSDGTVCKAVNDLVADIGGEVAVLSLIEVELRPDWQYLEWPAPPTEAERRALPHRLLRYLHEDEYPHEFLKGFAESPLKRWMNDALP